MQGQSALAAALDEGPLDVGLLAGHGVRAGEHRELGDSFVDRLFVPARLPPCDPPFAGGDSGRLCLPGGEVLGVGRYGYRRGRRPGEYGGVELRKRGQA